MAEDSSMVNILTSSPEAGLNNRVMNHVGRSNSKTSVTANGPSASPSFPPPKTDKPRPHVCTTCTRSFARLEHLKRHERSHTKEKPFQCSECTRCFARRDLLLRHQQKLHSSTTPSSRPRSGRRESVAGVQAGRVRKNSVAGATTAGMRPRANTLSHVDSARLGVLAQSHSTSDRNVSPALSRQHFSGINDVASYQFRNLANSHHHSVPTLPRLSTGLPVDIGGGLRTAPPFGGFGAEFGINMFGFGAGNANTINPHALHMDGMQGAGLDTTASPFQQYYGGFMDGQAVYDDEDNLGWMAQGFENQMSFAPNNDNAIDDSSPSAMSTNSPAAPSDLMLDNTQSFVQNFHNTPHAGWQNHITSQHQMVNSPINVDYGTGAYGDVLSAPNGTFSPKSLYAHNSMGLEMNFATPPDLSTTDSAPPVPEFNGPPFHLPLNKHSGTSSASTSSVDSSLRQSYSSITTVSGELVNDQVRNSLIAGLAQSVGFGQRKHSQPSISSPLSPNSGYRGKAVNVNNCPSTQDLQRYISAYVQYFHPHLPFMHIPTLNFDSLDYSVPMSPLGGQTNTSTYSVTNGGSCLVLSMAAIGALYENEMNSSKDLFESGKRLISCYLEERRKANLSRTQLGPNPPMEVEDTPLWLVQAMLLNVIYGHNCGDKTAAEIASNHCSALVSLARGAELARPPPPAFTYPDETHRGTSQSGGYANGMVSSTWNSMVVEPDDSDWRNWKYMEERKRTLYAVFILSSLLVSAYNHPPAITNSEIRLELPCEEELWSAESAQAWRALGGSAVAESNTILFSAALGHLLTAAQRQRQRRNSGTQWSPADGEHADGSSHLKPSTFGCLILVNALHNYIWETRQRHLGRQWTAQETEQMHAHIEPALKAWQAAWAGNPSHSLERPNPFGAGPLSADSIPLLDLAYVGLFVNLGRSKEAFWQRDFNAMAEELAKSPEVMQPGELNQTMNGDMRPPPRRPSQSSSMGPHDVSLNSLPVIKSDAESPVLCGLGESPTGAIPTTRRERHLRKAAFYAADSLSMSDRLGLTFADQASRELPMQSAMCAFDCAQVLAEWVTTLQERVGKYLGIIGREELDLAQVPGILLLEDEDRRLLQKVREVLEGAKHKMNAAGGYPEFSDGYGSQILKATAHVLERAAVWPVTKLMARSLETQAEHMQQRANMSTTTRV